MTAIAVAALACSVAWCAVIAARCISRVRAIRRRSARCEAELGILTDPGERFSALERAASDINRIAGKGTRT